MIRTAARKRRLAIRRKLLQIAAWAVIVLAEIAATMVSTVLLALVVVPLARAERGYEAFGGEWMLIGAVFVATYCAAHRWVYHKIFGEGKHR